MRVQPKDRCAGVIVGDYETNGNKEGIIMIFDVFGLPKDNGASDLQDSARLAGIMTVFGWPQKINLPSYLSVIAVNAVTAVNTATIYSSVTTIKKYVRHPQEIKYDFSRDQAICLMAGFFTQKLSVFVDKNFIDGKDFFSPSHNGHVRICQGLKPRWYQNLWLMLDIIYNILLTPRSEPNQILCMLMVHPDSRFLKFWLKHNKHWRDAIREYWCEGAGEWRKEPELAEHMIHVLELKVNG